MRVSQIRATLVCSTVLMSHSCPLRSVGLAWSDGQCSSIGICEGVPSTVPAQSPILTWVDDVFQEPCATRRDTDSVFVGLADHGSRGHENDFSGLLDGLEEDLGVTRVVDPVPSPRHMPRRSGWRVVLVPGSPDATPQSIQNRFLVDEGSLTDAVSTGGANLQFRQGGCPVTLQNRFDPLIHNADSAPAISRPEEFAMTEASCTESQEFRRPSWRLRLVWNLAAQDEAAPMDSHDQRLERVRRVVQRERNDRRVLASEFVITAAERIGFVDPGGEIPRQVRQLRWSVFNVPLMWAAAAGEDDCAVLGWMSARAENLPHITIDGEHVPAPEALRVGWEALRDTLRSWDIRSREDLAEWMHRQGFIRPRW